MKLGVRVIEARNLLPMDLNGFSDPYVKLKLGKKQKCRTKVVYKCLEPKWDEEFSFHVDDLNEELIVSVLDEDKYFNDDFLGYVKVPVSHVFDAPHNSIGPSWFTLLPKTNKKKSKTNNNHDNNNNHRGEILLSIYFIQNNALVGDCNGDPASHSRKHSDLALESQSSSSSGPLNMSSPVRAEESSVSKDENSCPQKTLVERIAQIFNRNPDTSAASTVQGNDIDFQETRDKVKPEFIEDKAQDQPSSVSFEETMKAMVSIGQATDIPRNLPGGILLDQAYVIAPSELNKLIFSPDSSFPKSLADLQGTTEYNAGPWKFENGGESLKRLVTYTKGPTKLVKAVKATEEQTYLMADGKNFAVLVSVSTPEVVYGSTFKVELLYCITPGPELPSGEELSRLVISWRVNFLQSVMVKGMIEKGAGQGMQESFEQFASLLSQNVKTIDLKDLASEKEQALSSLQAQHQSDWKLAVQYFANFTVVSTIFIGLYVLVHIWLAKPNAIQGLEFEGLDLPDSIGEVIVCGILVLQGERLLGLISQFMQARVQRGSGDHGVKAQGDGWLLTVALIEASNLAAVDSTGFSDPYVVFTCNGQTRTSSIKFQICDPLWNEIFEFDAMDEPPSVLDVEVFDFDGPFDEATSLGHAEINFLKSDISNLADIWVPLQGKLALACQSKLHLRIFLDNTRGGNVVKEYMTKMEKEVGKKLNVRSPQTNSAFQKLFGLPPEEFLINDFTCHLKRKMPLQGRLFLSARIIGFHANLFGHKTTFFFLWEDIEDIQVIPPTLASMGSPIIVITLRPGRGLDARHGAKTEDQEGRLKFHFHSFVSFNIAHRTIMALWRARSLSPEQKVQIVEEESGAKSLPSEENGSYLGLEAVSMSEVYSSSLPVPTSFIMEVFGGGDLDRRVMEKAGCLDYSTTPWESDKSDVYERQLHYKYDKSISRYRVEVTSTQQKSPLPDRTGWVVEEVMTLHGIPLGDYFNLHLRYQIKESSSKSKSKGCHVQVLFGIAWLKSTKHKKRLTKNILSNLQDRLKVIFSVVEKEFLAK